MSDVKDLLRRAQREFPPPENVMEALVRRRERQQRHRRAAAIIVASALAIAIAGTAYVLRSSRPMPADEGDISRVNVGTVTIAKGTCRFEGARTVTAEQATLLVVNESDHRAVVDFVAIRNGLEFARLERYVANQRERVRSEGSLSGPPRFVTNHFQTGVVPAGGSELITGPVYDGTHGIICFGKPLGERYRPIKVLGPIEITRP